MKNTDQYLITSDAHADQFLAITAESEEEARLLALPFGPECDEQGQVIVTPLPDLKAIFRANVRNSLVLCDYVQLGG